MTSRSPLPARVLIPVANPATAEELIRIGASLADRRAGELTALGIVEVPEGMPLSEGASRARQARRLLQRVLDFAPEGTTIHPIVRIGRHTAEGIVAAAERYEKSEAVNLGAGFEIRIRDLVPLVARLCRFEGDIVWDQTKPDGQPRRMLDTSKALREFGWKARIGFEDGLRETVAWFEQNREKIT